MRAIGYLRGLPDWTLEQQYRAFLAYCEREGLEVGPAYTEAALGDPGAEGSPQLVRLLRQLQGARFAEAPRTFTVVVVADLQVLGERVQEQARRYLQLDALGVPLRLADGREVDDAMLDAWRERDDSQRRREQVRAAMRRRALRGEVLGRPPYGYRVEDRHLVPDPGEADVVREIARLAVDEDLGVRRIARALNDRGIRTRKGQPWSMVSVRSLLRNPVYTGTYRRLDVVVPRAHEALIPRDRFEAIQRRLDARRNPAGRQHRHDYLLSGLARCGYCGNRMIGVTRAGAGHELISYQCESRQNQSRCEYHTHRAADLEAAVRDHLRALDPPVRAAATDPPAEDAERLHARRRALQRDLARQLEQRAAGRWSAETLRREAAAVVLADLEAEDSEAAFERRGRLALDEARRIDGIAADRERLVERWDALTFAERRELLQRVVAEVVVRDDGLVIELAH